MTRLDMDIPTRELFVISRGVLRAEGDLYWESLEDFEKACDKLLESRASRLVLDLTAVNFISSAYVGCLGNLVLQAARRNKRLVLKASRDASWLFEFMDITMVMELEIS